MTCEYQRKIKLLRMGFDVGATAFILQSSVTSSSSITALDLVQFDHLMFDSVNATTCALSLQLRSITPGNT
ncbi:unnamed protein product [Microthlaspi erraticum]|uniref:Uncharacterized protein n=1 Tax=Microthlaspi erraticum TaxID=1685480 RepID=A0A6D2JMR6_9BRAS|nr:unnamed protein product [Microthlaspi erraticum]